MVENLIETVVSVSVVVVIRIGTESLDGAGGSVGRVSGGITRVGGGVGIGSSANSIGTSAVEARVPAWVIAIHLAIKYVNYVTMIYNL